MLPHPFPSQIRPWRNIWSQRSEEVHLGKKYESKGPVNFYKQDIFHHKLNKNKQHFKLNVSMVFGYKASSCADLQKAAEAAVKEAWVAIWKGFCCRCKLTSAFFRTMVSTIWIPWSCLQTKESRGHCSELTKKLAGIGSHGRHPQNAERDLFRVLDLPIDLCQELTVQFSLQQKCYL